MDANAAYNPGCEESYARGRPRFSLGVVTMGQVEMRAAEYKRMRQSHSIADAFDTAPVSLFLLYTESLHFDLIYPSSYRVSYLFLVLKCPSLGSSIQTTMSLRHYLN